MPYTKIEGVFNKQVSETIAAVNAGIELNFTVKAVKRVDEIEIQFLNAGASGLYSGAVTNVPLVGRVILFKGSQVSNRLNSWALPIQAQVDGDIIRDCIVPLCAPNKISFFPSVVVNPEDSLTVWFPSVYDPTTQIKVNGVIAINVNGQYLAYKQTTRLLRKDFLNSQDAE